MNILLVNDNPVVSRLLALCTREEHIILEEVAGVDTIQHGNYDVVFIDEGSYKGDVLNLSDILTIGKKVLLSNVDVEINDFDLTIKKPFLPSQIIEILEHIEEADDVLEEEEEVVSSIFPLATETEEVQALAEHQEETEEEIERSDAQVLDTDELEKIKALLDMDDETEEVEENLSEEEIEVRKVEVIKEQLIADGLEIVGEEEIMDELSVEDEVIIFSNEESEEVSVQKSKKNKKTKSSKKKDKKSKKKSKKSVDFSEEELERIEDAVQVAIATLKRKQMKKLLKGKEIEVSIKLEEND